MPFKKGHGPWHKGRKGLYHTSEETKRKLSELRKGKHYPKLSMARKGKHYPKLSEALKGKPHPTPWLKSKPRSNEVRRKISEAQKGRVFTEQHKQKLAVAHIEAMKRGCYNIRPNVPEKKFIEICAKYNLPFKYTGDGSYSIERMNPDFVEINGKKICVEVLGTYWHGPAKPKGNFEKRKQRLVEQGWTVIGIWERELKKLPEEEIVKRVLDQTNRIRMGRYIIDKEANR